MSYIKEKYADQLAPKMTLKDVSGFRTYPIQPSDDDWMEETYHEDFTMANLVKFLDTQIVGNADVKRCIAKALYMGFEYHACSNLLVAGPSGSGKSLMMQTLADEWKAACGTIVNASLLTSEGYRGGYKISSIIEKLKAEGHISKNGHHTFIQIDEFDKIVDNIGEHNYSLRVQDELLLYMSHIGLTENVSFICYGAFSSLYEKHRKTPIGFGMSTNTADENLVITRDMLVDYGFRAELIGRFNSICQTQRLDYRRIADMELEKLAKTIDMGINIDRDILYRIADEAKDSPYGSRIVASELRSLVEEYIFTHPNARCIELTESIVAEM